MFVFACATICLIGQDPQPLRLKDVTNEPWGEIVRYSEGSVSATVMRNLLVNVRQIGKTGQFEVEVHEVGRKLESLKNPEFVARFTKYLDDLPKVRVTDVRGRSAPKGMNSSVYPSGFWGFFLPEKLEPGQLTWLAELQPPFHTRWATTPPSHVTFRFDTKPKTASVMSLYHTYEYSSDATFNAQFPGADVSTVFHLRGMCWIDPKSQQIAQAACTATWIASWKERSKAEAKYEQVEITHDLRRGQKWDLN